MSGTIKDIAPYAAAAAAMYASGGTAEPMFAGAMQPVAAGAAEGAGAAGLMGGDAALGAGAIGAGEASGDMLLSGNIGTSLPEGFGYMGNGSIGSTIEAAGLSPNSYTGGYDALNPLQRIGQRVGGFMDGHGTDALRMVNQMSQRPRAQQAAAQAAPPSRRPQQEEQQPSQPLYGNASQGVDFNSLSPDQRVKLQGMLLARMGAR